MSINRSGDLDLGPFNLKIGSLVTLVMDFHAANVGLRKPFRYNSRVISSHSIDRQKDRQSDGRTTDTAA